MLTPKRVIADLIAMAILGGAAVALYAVGQHFGVLP